MIKNNLGQVAVAFYMNRAQRVVVGERQYIFVPRGTVSMAWINEEDVPALLEKKKTCRCANSSPTSLFRLATQQMVNIWTGQGDPREGVK